MKYEYIFWDWNGTLFNDAKASWLAVNDMLIARNLPLISFEQYREYVDVPIMRFYDRVMDTKNESIEALSDEFHALCYSHLPSDPLAIGAKEMLEFLANNGVKQYIFSSSHKNRIITYLDKMGIQHYFDYVLAADDFHAASKIDRTRDFIIEKNIPVDKIVFIGDLIHDSEVAASVGSDCILVGSGHQPISKLVSTGANVVNSIHELYNIFSCEVV